MKHYKTKNKYYKFFKKFFNRKNYDYFINRMTDSVVLTTSNSLITAYISMNNNPTSYIMQATKTAHIATI